jgi:hypothetical protein
MKVRELIEALKMHGQDAEVYLVTDWEYRNQYHGLESVSCDSYSGNIEVYLGAEGA